MLGARLSDTEAKLALQEAKLDAQKAVQTERKHTYVNESTVIPASMKEDQEIPSNKAKKLNEGKVRLMYIVKCIN